MNVGIVGAGLMGRLLAWQLALKGWSITLFEQHAASGVGSAAYAAGGMLSPIAERQTAEPLIEHLGYLAIPFWKQVVTQLQKPVYFQQQGSVMLSHQCDDADLMRVIKRLEQRGHVVRRLNATDLAQLEPELQNTTACFLSGEAQIDARDLLHALLFELQSYHKQVTCFFDTWVKKILPHQIMTASNTCSFDWVFDCRGFVKTDALSELYCCRGELIYLYAPDVQLNHVIRLLHPRYTIYIIPRPNYRYLIGATEIESHDTSSISVRSCLELLSAAYSVHAGFAEARICETVVGQRPVFPDHLPRLFYQEGLMAVNGLYRHGFLIAPPLVDEVIRVCEQGRKAAQYPQLLHETFLKSNKCSPSL